MVWLTIAVRVGGVVSGMWLGAIGNFIARVAIAFAWDAVDAIGSNAFFEFFDLEQNHLFHFLVWFGGLVLCLQFRVFNE
jgi:hypothetical protein